MRPRLVGWWSAAIMLTTMGGAAIAQEEKSIDALRDENSRLQHRVDELERELDESSRRIRRLEDLIRTLRRQIQESNVIQEDGAPPTTTTAPAATSRRVTAAPAASGPEPSPPREVRIPDDPFGSLDALLRLLREEFAAFEAPPIDANDQRAQDRRLKHLSVWSRRMAQQHREPIEWTVELIAAEPFENREVRVQVQPVDPTDGVALGEPFFTVLDPRVALRLMDHPNEKRWVLEGVLGAAPEVNPDRPEEGLFATPPLVAPFVEFRYDLVVRSFRPAKAIGAARESAG